MFKTPTYDNSCLDFLSFAGPPAQAYKCGGQTGFTALVTADTTQDMHWDSKPVCMDYLENNQNLSQGFHKITLRN